MGVDELGMVSPWHVMAVTRKKESSFPPAIAVVMMMRYRNAGSSDKLQDNDGDATQSLQNLGSYPGNLFNLHVHVLGNSFINLIIIIIH